MKKKMVTRNGNEKQFKNIKMRSDQASQALDVLLVFGPFVLHSLFPLVYQVRGGSVFSMERIFWELFFLYASFTVTELSSVLIHTARQLNMEVVFRIVITAALLWRTDSRLTSVYPDTVLPLRCTESLTHEPGLAPYIVFIPP
jgi:hypothetical protein